VFTNCERVALFRNGREILSAQGRQHLVLSAEFEPGVLEARGWKGADQVSDGIESFGPAKSLRVQPENEKMVAAARGTTGVRISVVDERGVLCRDWQGEAVVEVTGAARSRVYTPGGMIPLWGGEGRTFITGCGQAGKAVVKAVCPPLCGGTAEVTFA
jgi:hypothetical protein